MKDFIQRVITKESKVEIFDADGEKLPLIVSRSRNTNGFCSIRFSLGKQTFEISSDIENYEGVALELSDLLSDIATNPCTIPSVGQPK